MRSAEEQTNRCLLGRQLRGLFGTAIAAVAVENAPAWHGKPEKTPLPQPADEARDVPATAAVLSSSSIDL